MNQSTSTNRKFVSRKRQKTDQLPSPLRTPSSTSNGKLGFETPKPGKHTHSAGSERASHRSPNQNLYITPKQNVGSAPEKLQPVVHNQLNAELARHVHHTVASPLIDLPPVEASKQLGSSPSFGGDSATFTPFALGQSPRIVTSVGFLQTPPPSAPLRVAKKAEMPDKKNSSANARALMPPPDTPSRFVQPSPQFFPNLQFSPDMYQFSMSGPATAPVLPQQKLFWDSSNGTDGMPGSVYQDAFSHDHGGFINSMFPSPGLDGGFGGTMSAEDSHIFGMAATTSLPPPKATVDAFIDGPPLQTSFTASPRPVVSKAEDPSLFLSSPARRFGPSDPPIGTSGPSSWDRPAYHHQIEESRRERDVERNKKTKAKRISGALAFSDGIRRSNSPARDARPGLKRSLTHTGVGSRSHLRNQSHVSFADSVASSGNASLRHNRAGRASPLKTNRDSYNSITSRNSQHTSLSLKIDEDGRARTVVTKSRDPNSSFMDLDEESSSDSDSASDLDGHVTSKHNSFALSDRGRIDRDFYPRTVHSKTSSYSTHASTNSIPNHVNKAQIHRARSAQSGRNDLKNAHNNNVPLSERSFYNDADIMDEGQDSDRGDAQQALREMMKERPNSRSTHHSGASGRASISLSQYHSSPPIQQTTYGAFNNSPTTITDPDAVTPSTDRESLASNGSGTRCICTSTHSDGQFMIQW